MADIYDNWERLVNAVLRRESDRQRAFNDSTEPSSIGSPSSTTSDFSCSSRFDQDQDSFVQRQRIEVPMDYSELVLSHSEWKAMLPPNQHEVTFRSASLSFFLDKRTGKNCFILGAMRLQYWPGMKEVLPERIQISVQENFIPGGWERKPHPKSRFLEVAELQNYFGFEIKGKINEEMLSPETTYATYVVFEFAESYKNVESAECRVKFSSDDLYVGGRGRVVHFQSGSHRADGWMEVEIGSFHVPRHQKNRTITAMLWSWSENIGTEYGLIVEGIEFRPLRGKGIFFRS